MVRLVVSVYLAASEFIPHTMTLQGVCKVGVEADFGNIFVLRISVKFEYSLEQ